MLFSYFDKTNYTIMIRNLNVMLYFVSKKVFKDKQNSTLFKIEIKKSVKRIKRPYLRLNKKGVC